MNKLQSYLKTIRVVLIFLTVFELIYLGVTLSDKQLRLKLDDNFQGLWVILIFHIVMLRIILWLNWTKFPINKKMKMPYAYIVVFLGIVRMWLWMPSCNDIDKLSNYFAHLFFVFSFYDLFYNLI